MLLAKLSINRPVLTTMTIMVFIIFGMIAFNGLFGLIPGKGLNLNDMPEVEIPYVTISTIYPGAGPKEIETQVTKKIEDIVATVSEIRSMQSFSLDGVSIIMMEFKLSKDVNVAFQEVKAKVDQIVNQLPDDAELPLVDKVDLQAFPVIDIILSGDKTPIELFELADKRLKDRFAQVKGVGLVKVVGGQEREIHINLSNKIVYENNISLPQLLQILNANNMDLPGGYLKVSDQELTVRLQGKYKSLDELREIEVPVSGETKKLRQIATIDDAGKNIRERAIFFDNKTKSLDENVVRLSIIKSSDGNAVNISKDVQVIIEELEQNLPEGVNLDVVNDTSYWTESIVSDTIGNITLGILFTSIILLLFIGDLRSTLIVVLSMPTSIVSTFLAMQIVDMTMNTMSLMGISVSVGVLVSNSVVVLENIFRHKNMGKSNNYAAYDGTREVVVAVVAATLTNVAVFLPLANMSSMVGLFIRDLALTATFSTLFSLFMSFSLTPLLASILLPAQAKSGPITRFVNGIERFWAGLYQKSLEYTLKFWVVSILIVLLSFVVLFWSAATFASQLGFEFIPTPDNGQIKVEVELPIGYNLDETSYILSEIQERIAKYEEVTHMVANVGKLNDLDLGTNLSLLEVHMVDREKRSRGLYEMIQVLTEDLASVPNAKIKVDPLDGGGPQGAPIEFFLVGQELEKLEELKVNLMAQFRGIEGIANLDNSSKSGKPEITIYPDRNKLAEAGLTVMDLAFTLRSSIEGMVSSQYSEFGNDYDIKVTLDDKSVDTPEKVGNITISGKNNSYRLSELADIDFSMGFTKILHYDKFLSIKFSASSAPGIPPGDVIEEVNRIIAETDLPEGYGIRWSGMAQLQQEMAIDFMTAIFLAFILTYMLLAAILESFIQPLIILQTFFLALIGVFILMYYTGTNWGITSFMGIIMLIGIVVNNAILLLDYANKLIREEGWDVRKALIEAGGVKLKPIIMATLAIILGMLPMALGIGDAGFEIRQPLGIVSIGGLIVSTVLTMWVIPSAYHIYVLVLDVMKKLLSKFFKIEFKKAELIK